MVEELQRLTTALSYLWIAHGHWPEGYSWLERALARPGGDPATRAKALNACASLAMEAGAIVDVGPLAEESARLFEQLGDELGVARSRTIEAWAREGAGDFDEAQRLHEEAIALTRPSGDARRLLIALNNLGNLHLARLDFAKAAQVLEEALELGPASRFPSSRGRILENLGFARLGLLDVGGAELCFLEAMRLLEVSGTETRATDSLLGAAAVAAAQHRWERSAKLMVRWTQASKRSCAASWETNDASTKRPLRHSGPSLATAWSSFSTTAACSSPTRRSHTRSRP
jgi:tetratricopeptide (TPR) repeat protein